MSIKKKLVITFLVVSVIPMIFVGVFFFHSVTISLQDARIAALDSIADLKVDIIEEFIDNLRKDATIAQDYFNIKTNMPLVTRFSDDRNNPAYMTAKEKLDSQLRTFQRVRELQAILLLSPAGEVVYVSDEAHEMEDLGARFENSIIFEEGKRGIYISTILRGRHESDAEMLVAAPVHGFDGNFLGLLVFEVNMNPLYEMIQGTIGLGETGETLIGQKRGDHLLFLNPLRHDPKAALQRRASIGESNAFPMQEAVQGREDTKVSIDYRGVEVLAAWRHIPSMGWGLVAKMDTSEAFNSITVMRDVAFIIGVLILILMTVVAVFIARSFSRPILALKEGIERVGEGNLDWKVGTDVQDEIGELSRAFDRMTGNLQTVTSSRDELEGEIAERKAAEQVVAAKNRELEVRGRYDQSYGEAITLFSSSYDREKVLTALLSIIAQNHPFPVSAVYLYDEWSGNLVSAASCGTSETLRSEFAINEGLVGQAAKENRTMVVDTVEGEADLTIETGVASIRPAAVVISPISYQDKVTGVLVLASGKPLTGLDTPFIQRLSAQVGVALNNLNQYNNLKDLSSQLKSRGKEISHKNQQLEEANRMKSDFLANMSHELRTPLNAIIGFSEVLKDGVMGDLNDEQREYIGDIFTSGQHLLSLINDILDLSKIEAGKMELDLEIVDVAELLKNSLSIIREKALAHRIKLHLDIGEGVERCCLDKRKAKQILYNLLSNAVKFTPEGGSVDISARLVGRVEVSALEGMGGVKGFDGDFLRISVADTGIGIAREDQERLFQPFTQVDSSLSRKYDGTGLGLVMVRRLAELHGGVVGVESEVGKGSTFTTWLPYRSEVGDGKVEPAVGKGNALPPCAGNRREERL